MSERLKILNKFAKKLDFIEKIEWNPRIGYTLHEKKLGKSFEEAYNFLLKMEKNND